MCKRDKDNVKLGEKKGFEIGFEKGFEKGFEIGFEKGMKIGIEKGKKIGIERDRDRVIRRCIGIGLPAEQICYICDVTREQLKSQYLY